MLLRELFDEFPIKENVVPLAVQQLLAQPLNVLEDWARAEKLLLEAKALMPQRPEINVALYKLYAYSNRFEESLSLIDETLNICGRDAGIDSNWRQLESRALPWNIADDMQRCYLYSMKAIGFVCLRLGEVERAHEVLSVLRAIDTVDSVGSSVLFDITLRLLDEDYEYVA